MHNKKFNCWYIFLLDAITLKHIMATHIHICRTMTSNGLSLEILLIGCFYWSTISYLNKTVLCSSENTSATNLLSFCLKAISSNSLSSVASTSGSLELKKNKKHLINNSSLHNTTLFIHRYVVKGLIFTVQAEACHVLDVKYLFLFHLNIKRLI